MQITVLGIWQNGVYLQHRRMEQSLLDNPVAVSRSDTSELRRNFFEQGLASLYI